MVGLLYPGIHFLLTLFFVVHGARGLTFFYLINFLFALFCSCQIFIHREHQNQPNYFSTSPSYIWSEISKKGLFLSFLFLLGHHFLGTVIPGFFFFIFYFFLMVKIVIASNRNNNFTFDLREKTIRIYQIKKLVFSAPHRHFTYQVSLQQGNAHTVANASIAKKEHYLYAFYALDLSGKQTQKLRFTCDAFEGVDLCALVKSLDQITYTAKMDTLKEDAMDIPSSLSAAPPVMADEPVPVNEEQNKLNEKTAPVVHTTPATSLVLKTASKREDLAAENRSSLSQPPLKESKASIEKMQKKASPLSKVQPRASSSQKVPFTKKRKPLFFSQSPSTGKIADVKKALKPGDRLQ